MSTPPSSTPMLPPPAATKPKTPIAFARSAGSVKSVMISDSATAETIAPPTPCTAARGDRASPATSARPQASDASVNRAMPSEEQPPLAEQVAEPAAEQQEAAEGQQVGVDDPRERRLARSRGRRGSRAARRSRSSCRARSSGSRGTARRARASGCGSRVRRSSESILSVGSAVETDPPRRTHRFERYRIAPSSRSSRSLRSSPPA